MRLLILQDEELAHQLDAVFEWRREAAGHRRQAIVRRYFPDLGNNDLMIEPSCVLGRFLDAIPAHVPAIGVEIGPVFAAEAAERTVRRIITVDFCSVDIDDLVAMDVLKGR